MYYDNLHIIPFYCILIIIIIIIIIIKLIIY